MKTVYRHNKPSIVMEWDDHTLEADIKEVYPRSTITKAECWWRIGKDKYVRAPKAPQYRAIDLPDDLDGWKKLFPTIKATGWVGVTDRNKHVHICSLTPSAEVHLLYPYAYVLDDEEDARERAEEEQRKSEYESVQYHDIRIHERPGVDWTFAAPDEEEFHLTSEEELEQVLEYWRGNCPI